MTAVEAGVKSSSVSPRQMERLGSQGGDSGAETTKTLLSTIVLILLVLDLVLAPLQSRTKNSLDGRFFRFTFSQVERMVAIVQADYSANDQDDEDRQKEGRHDDGFSLVPCCSLVRCPFGWKRASAGGYVAKCLGARYPCSRRRIGYGIVGTMPRCQQKLGCRSSRVRCCSVVWCSQCSTWR